MAIAACGGGGNSGGGIDGTGVGGIDGTGLGLVEPHQVAAGDDVALAGGQLGQRQAHRTAAIGGEDRRLG